MPSNRLLIGGCLAALALCAAAVALVLLVLSPPVFFRLLALAGVGMTLLSVVAMVASARRSTILSIKAQLLSVAVSIGTVVVFALLLGARVGVLAWLSAPLFGSLVGIAWSFTTRLRLESGVVRRQGNVLSLAAWAAVFVLQQALATTLGRVPATGTVLLLFGTGVVVGQSLTLTARTVYLRSTAAVLLAFCVAGLVTQAAAEEVLLLLPGEFDARPVRAWSEHGGQRSEATAKDLQNEGPPFRFRGEEVTQISSTTHHYTFPDCTVDIDETIEFRATFRRGVMRGHWASEDHNFNRGCKDKDNGEYMRSHQRGVVTGQADADGHLTVVIHVTDGDVIDRRMEWVGQGKAGRFVLFDEWKKRDQRFDPWSATLEFQLPVGELQSSQKLPTPVGRGEAPQTAPGGRPDADSATAPEPEGEPATPAETAAATVGSGLLAGVGAWLMARANGTGLGDLLGGIGGAFSGQPPPPALEPPRLLFQEPPHADGERNDRGEAWDARVGGWVDERLWAQDRQRDAWLEQKAAADLAAMRQPDELSGAARDIVAGEAGIRARGQEIAERDAQIRAEEEELRYREEQLGVDPLGWALRDHFKEYQGELSRQGYRVVNPAYDQALPVRGLVDFTALAVGSVMPDVQAVRCGEYAELGRKALDEDLRRRLGPQADDFIVDTVQVDVAKDGWFDKVQEFLDVELVPRNHVATRVILPDGRRFVLDYWEAGRGSGRQMVGEEQWLARWRERLGDRFVAKGSGDYGRQAAEERALTAVRDAVDGGGTEEDGLARFQGEELDAIRQGPGSDSEKAARMRQVDTLVRSYRRCKGLGYGLPGSGA